MLTTIIFIGLALLIAAAIMVVIAKAQSTHFFACKYCGEKFQPKWAELLFEVHAFNEHRLKCPHCGRKDFCTDTGKR